MVHRLLPQPLSRKKFYLRSFVRLALLITLFSVGGVCALGYSQSWSCMILVSLLCSAYLAWSITRQWTRFDWFSTERREIFLTTVEEGLIYENPRKGTTIYLPWRGLNLRCVGNTLQILCLGALRCLLPLNGLAPEHRERLLADMREHIGRAQSAEPATPPHNPGELPPVAAATLPPPAPMLPAAYVPYSNTDEQWKECLHYTARMNVWTVAILMLAALIMGTGAGILLTRPEPDWLCLCVALIAGLVGVIVLGRPGWRRVPRVPGTIHLFLTKDEWFEQTGQGAWGRYRLPLAAEGQLVRLPHSWCLLNKKGLPALLADARGNAAPPPALAHYPTSTAPRNRWRVLLVLLMMFGGLLGGHWVASPAVTEAELAFLALPPAPDAATLRHFAQTYYAHGEVLGTPSLHDMEEGGNVCVLVFTDSAPDPDEDDGSYHLAWEHWVVIDDDGVELVQHSKPVSWCPCNWHDGPPENEDESE